MSDHLNKKVLLVGAGPMAQAYAQVLKALNCETVVIGRGEDSAAKFEEATGLKVLRGGIDAYLQQADTEPASFDAAIIATPIDTLAGTARVLFERGFRYVLLEKPAGLNAEEINSVRASAQQHNAQVYVAYNRRFYASVRKARELIAADGGATSFNFEFTEWIHVIEKLATPAHTKAAWLLANSTHVIDLAFYLGGHPAQLSAFAAGQLDWHPRSKYAGAGITASGALFSYQANWAAPGRWGVEILTRSNRYIFRPLEELQVQAIGSVAVNKIDLDDSLDKTYKPGIYCQTRAFLQHHENEGLLSLPDYTNLVNSVYTVISQGNN